MLRFSCRRPQISKHLQNLAKSICCHCKAATQIMALNTRGLIIHYYVLLCSLFDNRERLITTSRESVDRRVRYDKGDSFPGPFTKNLSLYMMAVYTNTRRHRTLTGDGSGANIARRPWRALPVASPLCHKGCKSYYGFSQI